MTHTKSRNGFTLIELLVAMAIIAALAAMAAMVSIGPRSRPRAQRRERGDRHAEAGASDGRTRPAPARCPLHLRSWHQRARKARRALLTEMQYIEMPPPLIPNPNPLSTADPSTEPRVRFTYTISDGATSDTLNRTSPRGTINNRQCFIENLTPAQADAIMPGCTLVMPVFGAWHRIIPFPTGPAVKEDRPGSRSQYCRSASRSVPRCEHGCGHVDLYPSLRDLSGVVAAIG